VNLALYWALRRPVGYCCTVTTRQQKRIIEEYLATGHSRGKYWDAWPGPHVIERAKAADDALRGALVSVVKAREKAVPRPRIPGLKKLVELTRTRVEPMVRGLFARAEQDLVLGLLERSVVFVSPSNVQNLIWKQSFNPRAWDVANMYLLYIGAELLDEDVRIVGFSEETTCYVSPVYLAGRGPFDDFIVHEVAHVFHNWKREYAGLPHTKRKEWLLEIDFHKHETFAYTCEVFARILEQGSTPKERAALLEQYRQEPFGREHIEVGIDEHLDILNEAVSTRNGWKRILARCART